MSTRSAPRVSKCNPADRSDGTTGSGRYAHVSTSNGSCGSMPTMALIMQAVRDFRRSARSVRFKHMTKRAIDLVDGTTFRARPKPNPGGPTSAFYAQRGYAIFRNAIDRRKIDVLRTALETEVIASDGAFLRHKSVKREPNVFLPGTRIPNDGLLNPHGQPETARTAAAIESLLLTDSVADLLTSI